MLSTLPLQLGQWCSCGWFGCSCILMSLGWLDVADVCNSPSAEAEVTETTSSGTSKPATSEAAAATTAACCSSSSMLQCLAGDIPHHSLELCSLSPLARLLLVQLQYAFYGAPAGRTQAAPACSPTRINACMQFTYATQYMHATFHALFNYTRQLVCRVLTTGGSSIATDSSFSNRSSSRR